MTIIRNGVVVSGKVCKCSACGWSGPDTDVHSMAGFEFCPNCNTRYTGFMPGHIVEQKKTQQQPAPEGGE